MPLTSVIAQDIPAATQEITFYNPGVIEDVLFSNNTFTYAAISSFTLIKSDFVLFFANKLQFYNAVLNNFPYVGSYYFNNVLPASSTQMQISSHPSPNISFTHTSSESPTLTVVNITYDINAQTATFAKRLNAVTITMQEFLHAFGVLKRFAAQCALV